MPTSWAVSIALAAMLTACAPAAPPAKPVPPTKQTMVVGIPPNYKAILEAFPMAATKGVIFSYGDTLFNPHGVPIPREIIVHEAKHGLRQLDRGVEAWWARYLAEPLFRLDEEIYAHHAEYRACVKRHGHRDMDMRRIAHRLAGPLYGNLLSYHQAKHAIMTGEVR